jgi:small redox-active disulfide protein 2
MKIQILGSGCAKCKKLAETMENAAKELEVTYEIEKVTDIMKIMDFGVMSTPGLAIDGKVVLAGEIPSMDEAKRILSQ